MRLFSCPPGTGTGVAIRLVDIRGEQRRPRSRNRVQQGIPSERLGSGAGRKMSTDSRERRVRRRNRNGGLLNACIVASISRCEHRINGIKAAQRTFRFLLVRGPKSLRAALAIQGRPLLGGPKYFSGCETNSRYCPNTRYFRSLHDLLDSLLGYEGRSRVTW